MPQEQSSTTTEQSQSGKRDSDTVASAVVDRAAETAAQLRDASSAAIDEQKDDAADRIDHVASSIRSASDELRRGEEDLAARYVELGAERMTEVAEYLRGRSVRDLRRDASSAANAHPAIFLGGALFAGILIGRFLRASADEDDRG